MEKEKEIVEIKKEDIEVKPAEVQEEIREEKVVTEPKTEGTGISTAAMILGIVSVVLVGNLIVSLPCAILAIIFGLNGQKKEAGKGMAKAGFILGIVSLSMLAAIVIIIGMVCGAAILAAI